MTDLELVAAVAQAWHEWSDDPGFPFTPSCCVNGSRVARDVLAHFGVPSKPVSVQFVLFNKRGWECYEAGMNVWQWPEGAWSVGVGPEREGLGPDRWNGHLVLEGGGWTLDISARQFHRPGLIPIDNPLVMPVNLPPDERWLTSHGAHGLVLMIARFPANNAWRQASGWKRPHVAERYELTRRVQRVLEQRNTP